MRPSRRSRIALLYSLSIPALSIALTVMGMAAAVWHMGRRIAFGAVAAHIGGRCSVTVLLAA